jgi:hypothetical protein
VNAGAALLVSGALAVAAASACAQGAPAGDASMTLHLRSYYFDRQNPDAANNKATAIGGWVGLDSGWLLDRVRFGAVGYTSQKITGPLDEDGSLLLKPNQKSFGGLGELFAKVRLWEGADFTGYRQKVNQPEVNLQDNRMAPNTFEGYTLAGKAGDLEYYGGYLDKMKTRNATGFVNIARILNAPANVDAGMWLGGLRYAPRNDLALRLSTYHVPDLLNSTYADVSWIVPVRGDVRMRLNGQFMHQSSTGDNALTGASFKTSAGGLKADLNRGGATLSGFYTQTARGANYQTPFADWAGFAFGGLTSFDRAHENAFGVQGSYDFSANRLPGLVLSGYGMFGHNAINPATGAAVSDKTEYNATVDYRFKSGNWPEWIAPLSLRARVTRVNADLGGSTSVTRDYRFIVNYEQVLNF